MAKILDVTDANFEEQVMKSEVPVLIDFWAEWCAPCRQLAPVIKELAEEYGDKLLVAKVDVDTNPATASNLQIRAMPTLIFMKGGVVSSSIVGRQAKEKIQEQIDSMFA